MTHINQLGRVLLTGADGFTGVHARAELEAAGYEVIGAVIGLPAGAHEISLDITSLEASRRVMERCRPDFIMHLAGLSFVHQADALPFYAVNVVGTQNLLQGILDAGLSPRRVLIASSANVYGNTGGMLTEDCLPTPVNHYAVSKLAMEHVARTYADRLPIVLTRPFNYTGIGQAPHFLVPKMVSHFARHAARIELGNLDVERDFSDVRTVVRAYRALLQSDCAGQTVNICSGRGVSLRQIIGMLEALCGYQIEVDVNPAFVRANEVRTLLGSPTKLHALTGTLPALSLEQTLEWMLKA